MDPETDLQPMLDALAEGDIVGAREQARTIRRMTRKSFPLSSYPPRVAPLDESISPVTAPMLTSLKDGPRLADVALSRSAMRSLDFLVREQSKAPLLAQHGLVPRRRVLLVGPPGVGKSLTANALATELGWPAYVTRIDGLVRSYLGQTASRVREVFQFAATTRAVVLIDEIDAIARRRGESSDVGEIDRVVVTLLQELEHSQPAGLLVATSNLPEHLDDALWRRFDLVVRFAKPTRRQLEAFARRVAKRHVVPFSAVERRLEEVGNYADVTRLVVDVLRERLLSD